MRKPSLKTLQRTLWDLTKKVIRLRDKDRCQKCGRFVLGRQAETSHVIPKSKGLFLKFDLLNLKILCYPCHRWWHGNPAESGEWFRKKFPKRWEYLKRKKNQLLKEVLIKEGITKREFFEKKIEEFKECIQKNK